MNIANKVKLKYFLVLTLAFAFAVVSVKSLNTSPYSFVQEKKTAALQDTIPATLKTRRGKPLKSSQVPVKKVDTTILVNTEDSFHIKYSKDSLEAPISYDAEDSMIYDVTTNKITLYGKKAKTKFKDNELIGPMMEMDQKTGNISAHMIRDSTGKTVSLLNFTQGDMKSQMDSIKFNMKTGKGLTKSTYTQQGEMYVYGEVIKKVSPDVFFVKRGRITTCDLDTPHFAFVSNRFKFISKKIAITGPIHPEFEGVPIPIYLPFGIFPLNQGRHSGLLAPSFAVNQQYGIGLENGGYYKILGDNWDVIARGSIYSYGGWTADINPRYSKRYRYNGNINLAIQNLVFNHKGDPDYSKSRSFNIQWSHQQDTKARPGVSFSANVNAGSNDFYSHIPNSPLNNFNNQLTSSVAYSKTWKDKPFNLTVTANHNQNSVTKLINVDLPDVGFTVNTLYPFRNKESVGSLKWYENLGIGYNGEFRNHISFYDTVPNILRSIIDTTQYGAHHSIPISLSLPTLGIFQVSPSISYDETWFQRKIIQTWDSTNNRIDSVSHKGFYTARQMSFGLNVSTKIYGMYVSKSKTAHIVAIRHLITPTFGIAYHPDLNGNSEHIVQLDKTGYRTRVSDYGSNIYSPYTTGRSGGINFGVDNSLQMKVRSKKDTGEAAIKKVPLIDGFSISGFYNFLADSFPLQPLTLSARSTLFDKINITANGILEPYAVDETGRPLKNQLLISKNPLNLGRLTNASVSLSSHFQGGNSKDKKKDQPPASQIAVPPGYTNDDYLSEMNYIRNNPAEYADFSIPWSVNFSYTLQYSKSYYARVITSFEQDVNFGGTLNLTPKWQTAINGFYNLTEQQLGTLAVSISREMHCWQLGISLSPVGKYRFFSINLSPKSGLLRDLKINRTRSFYDGQ